MFTDEQVAIFQDFPRFAEAFLNIRTKAGTVKNFKLNRAQIYFHNRLEAQKKVTGKVRAVILKGRQQGCCFSEQMRILTADYRWIEIKNIQVGDKLVACDEESPGRTSRGRRKSRQFRTAIVEAKKSFIKEAFEICLENGVKLEVTAEHRMLCKKRGGDDQLWRHVRDFRIGDEIRVATRPPNYETLTYEDGWIAGMIDGEGSARLSGAKRLSITQVDNVNLRRIKKYLSDRNIPYKEVIDRRIAGKSSKLGNKPVHRIDIHRLPYFMEIFSRCRPTRFTNDEWHIGHELPGKSATDELKPWTKIISIRSMGKIKVIDLQTSTKTFICEGLVSHNSTMIQGRFFHQVVTQQGKKAFILTHEKEATEHLFGMARKFYEDMLPGLIPVADTANAKKLYFRELDSGYAVGTAGNKAVGRSQTIQLFHGSEIGYWQFAEEHAKGIMEAISSEPGTEIILESTANGIGNYFHERWLAACSENNEYQAIFLPWYWQDEYRDFTEGFRPTEEEEHYLSIYSQNGLSKEHLSWRRIKMSSYSKDEDAARESFQSQYPFTASEAFKNPIAQTFINSKYVEQARHRNIERNGRLIIGIDVAISDKDRTAIIRRRGRTAFDLEYITHYNTMEIAGRIKRIVQQENPYKVYVDCIGIGAGVVDRLNEMGLDCVEGVNVGRSANDKEKFRNLRAELWSDMRDWLQHEMGVEIPNSDLLHGELCSLGFKETSSGQIQIEGKDELRKRGMPSPDGADALALTFYGGNVSDMSANFDMGNLTVTQKSMFF